MQVFAFSTILGNAYLCTCVDKWILPMMPMTLPDLTVQSILEPFFLLHLLPFEINWASTGIMLHTPYMI